MNECPVSYTNAISTGICITPNDARACGGCNCGYLQFESLIPYLKELNDKLRENQEDFNNVEFRLRQEIIEISRLFDMEAGVAPGYFSTAHYQTTRVLITNDTKYLKVEDFMAGTLTVRTLDDGIVDPTYYGYIDGHLVYLPCAEHGTVGCIGGCNSTKTTKARPWPNSCYKVTAKWGLQCADYAVQMAVRDYLIEKYRMTDPVKVLASGLPVDRVFRVPHSWMVYIENFKNKNRIFSYFAVA